MKFLDIAKTIGGGLLSASGPAGALVMGAINAFLPDGEQLPATATGDDVQSAVEQLSSADQARLLEKEFDVDITTIKEKHSTVRAMLESDAKNPHTTRPYIAKGAFHVIAFAIVIAVSLWAYAVGTTQTEMVTAIMEGWPFVLGVIGPLVTLLWAYFGVLKTEHKDRLQAAGGNPKPSGLAGLISAFTKK